MASSAGSKKEEKKEETSDISKLLGKRAKNLVAGSLVFLITVFILGEAYAYYAMKSGSALLLWLPVFILMAVLFVKVIE